MVFEVIKPLELLTNWNNSTYNIINNIITTGKRKSEKMLDIIVNMAREYFESNPDSLSFDISRAILEDKAGIGTTKAISECKKLAFDYNFIKLGRGKLTIDKIKFLMWHRLNEQQKKQEITFEDLYRSYPEKVKNIGENEERIEYLKNKVKELDDRLDKQKREIAELEERLEKLPDQISYLKAKNIELSAKVKPLQEERNRESEDYNRLSSMMLEFGEEKAKKGWLFRQINRKELEDIRQRMNMLFYGN